MEEPKAVYKISCKSSCGSYFSSYLQSVTVIAFSKEGAICLVKDWVSKRNPKFIKPESEWEVEELCKVGVGIIDWLDDSDY